MAVILHHDAVRIGGEMAMRPTRWHQECHVLVLGLLCWRVPFCRHGSIPLPADVLHRYDCSCVLLLCHCAVPERLLKLTDAKRLRSGPARTKSAQCAYLGMVLPVCHFIGGHHASKVCLAGRLPRKANTIQTRKRTPRKMYDVRRRKKTFCA